MSFLTRKASVSDSLRSFRARIMREGTPLFRVIQEGGNRIGDYLDLETANNLAADLASLHPGDSVFVSERRELDGVQVLVGVREWCYSFAVDTKKGVAL